MTDDEALRKFMTAMADGSIVVGRCAVPWLDSRGIQIPGVNGHRNTERVEDELNRKELEDRP